MFRYMHLYDSSRYGKIVSNQMYDISIIIDSFRLNCTTIFD